jgi:hypothetical protein
MFFYPKALNFSLPGYELSPSRFCYSNNNERYKYVSGLFQKVYSKPSRFLVSWDSLESKSCLSVKNISFTEQEILNTCREVPIYCILNGLGEITSLVPSNSTKLALFFLNRKDAEAYFEEILCQDSNRSKLFGLAIHCITLKDAYSIIHDGPKDVGFRFIPDLREIEVLAGKKYRIGTPTNLNLSYNLNTNVRNLPAVKPVCFTTKVNRLTIPLNTLANIETFFTSALKERSELVIGTPIYLVQTPDSANCKMFWVGKELFSNISSLFFFEVKSVHTYLQTFVKSELSENKILLALDSPQIKVLNLENFLTTLEKTTAKESISEMSNFRNVRFRLHPEVIEEVDKFSDFPDQSLLMEIKNLLLFKSKRIIGFFDQFLNCS